MRQTIEWGAELLPDCMACELAVDRYGSHKWFTSGSVMLSCRCVVSPDDSTAAIYALGCKGVTWKCILLVKAHCGFVGFAPGCRTSQNVSCYQLGLAVESGLADA